MTVLELKFSTGRYHATPWGRNVNEGAVEWPPSPWRIVRALIATWYLKGREIEKDTVRALINTLSQQLPDYRLPLATTAHTRHYMPGNEPKHKQGKDDVFGPKKTKVFDTFIQIAEKETVLVAWTVDLPLEQLEALKLLANRLGYLGRAESLVEARVLEGVAPIKPNAAPLAAEEKLEKEKELVCVIAPMNSVAYSQWRDDFLKTNQQQSNDNKKAGKKSKAVMAPSVPDDLFDALQADTGELQAAGWNIPPGATFVDYTRCENAFAPPTKPRPRRGLELPIVARYAVVSAVAPSIAQAVSVADRVHDALCKRSDQGEGRAAVFTGLDDNGKPRTDHGHAHIFCEANGPRDAVTHITIWATMGFDEAACLALRRLKKVWGHGGHDIRLVLHGIGSKEDFKECPLFAEHKPAKVWRSFTPFVSTRHAKTFRDGRPKMDANGWQVGSAAHDLLRLLALHPDCAAATLKQIDERDRPFQFGNHSLRSLQFQTMRHNGGGNRGNSSGNAFVITFAKPVCGPLALGYGSHFGLGLFRPDYDFKNSATK